MDILFEDARFYVGAHERALVIVWGRKPQAEDLRQISAQQRLLVARYGHCVSMSIIRAKVTLKVEDSVREASAANMREFGRTNKGAAVVVEAGGLRAALVRSVITSVQLLAFSPIPQKIFSTIDDGVNWLITRPGVDPGLASRREAIATEARALAGLVCPREEDCLSTVRGELDRAGPCVESIPS